MRQTRLIAGASVQSAMPMPVSNAPLLLVPAHFFEQPLPFCIADHIPLSFLPFVVVYDLTFIGPRQVSFTCNVAVRFRHAFFASVARTPAYPDLFRRFVSHAVVVIPSFVTCAVPPQVPSLQRSTLPFLLTSLLFHCHSFLVEAVPLLRESIPNYAYPSHCKSFLFQCVVCLRLS